MRSVDRSAARRWARALLDVALERENAGGAGPAELAQELTVFVNLLRENHDLSVALAHPAIANDRRKGIGEAICASARASEILTRLIQMLIERQRVAWLPEITALAAAVAPAVTSKAVQPSLRQLPSAAIWTDSSSMCMVVIWQSES